mmetsp:Transcript_36958/g.105067  ORF Transcript_36958/g.105067 Transcript_36958/m.105067 type:complete len:264 (-) Transcript_36958:144-935(-)
MSMSWTAAFAPHTKTSEGVPFRHSMPQSPMPQGVTPGMRSALRTSTGMAPMLPPSSVASSMVSLRASRSTLSRWWSLTNRLGRASGTWWMFAQGVNWVIANGERPAIISASLAGERDDTSMFMETVMERAVSAGIPVVVAAANTGRDACGYSPAYIPEVITVGAIDEFDSRPFYSNFGPCVDIFAPGSRIKSAWKGSDTDSAMLSGTSQANPHVAGVVAMMLAADPSLSPSDIMERLRSSAAQGRVRDAGSGSPNLLLHVGAR